jgi:hypothetical protein
VARMPRKWGGVWPPPTVPTVGEWAAVRAGTGSQGWVENQVVVSLPLAAASVHERSVSLVCVVKRNRVSTAGRGQAAVTQAQQRDAVTAVRARCCAQSNRECRCLPSLILDRRDGAASYCITTELNAPTHPPTHPCTHTHTNGPTHPHTHKQPSGPVQPPYSPAVVNSHSRTPHLESPSPPICAARPAMPPRCGMPRVRGGRNGVAGQGPLPAGHPLRVLHLRVQLHRGVCVGVAHRHGGGDGGAGGCCRCRRESPGAPGTGEVRAAHTAVLRLFGQLPGTALRLPRVLSAGCAVRVTLLDH